MGEEELLSQESWLVSAWSPLSQNCPLYPASGWASSPFGDGGVQEHFTVQNGIIDSIWDF